MLVKTANLRPVDHNFSKTRVPGKDSYEKMTSVPFVDVLKRYGLHMYKLLNFIAMSGFVVLPAIVFYLRYARSNVLSGTSAFLVVSLVGWLLLFAANRFGQLELDDVVLNHPNPSEKLLDQWASDGGSKSFAAVFGWAFALIWALPCYLIYRFAVWRRNRAS